MGFDAVVHVPADRKVVDADGGHLSLDDELRGRRADVDKVFDELVALPAALGVPGPEQNARSGWPRGNSPLSSLRRWSPRAGGAARPSGRRSTS